MTTFLAWFQRIAPDEGLVDRITVMNQQTAHVYLSLLMALSDAQRYRLSLLISKYY